jgi:hypothetical protein
MGMNRLMHPAWGGAFITGAGGALGVGLVVVSGEMAAALIPRAAILGTLITAATLTAVMLALHLTRRPAPVPHPVLVATVLRLCGWPLLVLWAALTLLRLSAVPVACGSAAGWLTTGLAFLVWAGLFIIIGLQLRAGLRLFSTLKEQTPASTGLWWGMLGIAAGGALGLALHTLHFEPTQLALIGGLSSLLGGWAVVARHIAGQRQILLVGTAVLMMLTGWLIAAAWLLEGATRALKLP